MRSPASNHCSILPWLSTTTLLLQPTPLPIQRTQHWKQNNGKIHTKIYSSLDYHRHLHFITVSTCITAVQIQAEPSAPWKFVKANETPTPTTTATTTVPVRDKIFWAASRPLQLRRSPELPATIPDKHGALVGPLPLGPHLPLLRQWGRHRMVRR